MAMSTFAAHRSPPAIDECARTGGLTNVNENYQAPETVVPQDFHPLKPATLDPNRHLAVQSFSASFPEVLRQPMFTQAKRPEELVRGRV